MLKYIQDFTREVMYMGILKDKIYKNIADYARNNFDGVLHTTLNPDGPGVVRIHMIPPKFEGDGLGSSVVIVNGQDILPINSAWSILLAEFIKEVNKYSGTEVSDADVNSIMNNTIKNVRKVFPLLSKKTIRQDIYRIMNTFKQVAYGEPVDEDIQYISLGEYAPYMTAPHRMDLMVSAMTKEGCWHCNQKCVHCYAAGQTQADEAELSTADWKEIIDRCRKSSIPQLTFTGGEPTMREDLLELIDYSRWFVTRLNTNGRKLTKEYCEALREVSLDSMQITFYSNIPEVHNKLVGAPGFEDTVAGIENALEAGLNISINTPLCTLNRDYVETLKFLHEKGVMYVTCSGLITTGNAESSESESLQLTNDEIKDILRAAVEYAYANGMEISFTSPGWVDHEFCEEVGITSPTCGACLSNMAITPGGNVVPCQSWLSGDVLGNMLSDDWESIWNSPACEEKRDYSSQMLGLCPLRKERK